MSVLTKSPVLVDETSMSPLDMVVLSLCDEPKSLLAIEDELRQGGALSRFWGTVTLEDVVGELYRIGLVSRTDGAYAITEIGRRYRDQNTRPERTERENAFDGADSSNRAPY